ncbi:MAG: CGGC domain-containing protein [Thermodesulfobacteriota bacterium]|nr:CGGC domain-containing protein [Thermodesulfobacteriota bacterium]
MTKIALIRCEKNMDRCPLTGCFTAMIETKEGFSMYDQARPAGVFTCRCPGDNVVDLAKILASKGAEAIHFCTCTFAKKEESGWELATGGFCDHIDDLIKKVHQATGLACVKGSAHLPEGYTPQIWR